MERGAETCRLIDFPVVESGQLPQSFREWLGRLMIRCFSKSENNFRRLRDVFGLGRPLSENETSVLESRRPPDVTCGAAILDDTIQDGGAGNDVNQDLGRTLRSLLRWRPKMAALPLPAAILDDLISGSGNEVIQDGGRKRKDRHFPPPPQ